MKNAGIIVGVLLGISAVLQQMGIIRAQGGISLPETEQDSPNDTVSSTVGAVKGAADYIGQVKDLVDDAVSVTEKGKQLTAELEDKAQETGIRAVLDKVWGGLKNFFAEKSTRDLVVDTLKLGLQLVANMFIIVANVIEKVLAAV